MFQPKFEIAKTLLKKLTRCTELQTWISLSKVKSEWQPKLSRETALRLAHFSTSIEGNSLSLTEVQALDKQLQHVTESVAELEVKNYLEALYWIWKQPLHTSINEKKLLHLHGLITKGLLPDSKSGCYKEKVNKIVDYRGHVVYTAPSPQKSIGLTKELLAWIAQESKQLHPVLVSAIAHHQLVSIHPFSDGNGRTARALSIWILHNQGFDAYHLLSIDEYFAKDRARYYAMLQQARDLDWMLTYWLEYATDGMLEALKAAKKKVESLHLSKSKRVLTPQEQRVLAYISEKGVIRSPEIEKAFHISRARVSQILKPLAQAKLIVKEGHTRATSYRLKA